MKFDESLLYNIKSDYQGIRYSLFDLATWKNGLAFKKIDFSDKGLPVIKIAELNNGISSNTSFTQGDYGEEVFVQWDDLLFSWSGNPQTSIDVFRYRLPDGWLNQHIFKVTANIELVTKDFLYYTLKYLKPYFTQIATNKQTTGLGHVTIADLKRMSVVIPQKGIQEQITSILKAIDDKIEVNSNINENLAVLLQTVYQERFGDVDIAAKQGVLSDICSYSKDRVAVSELDVTTYFSTENMLPRKAGSTDATSLPTTPQTTACHKGDTLISNIRPYFKKIVYCEDECGCSTDVLCFTPNQPQYSAYLFSTLYADKFFAFMVAGAKGTKMPRGDKQQIMTYPIVLPSEVALVEFNTIALPLIKQIYSNRAENKRLSLLRDTLLPKLMSGELDVSDIDL